jgi:hypothetical protein
VEDRQLNGADSQSVDLPIEHFDDRDSTIEERIEHALGEQSAPQEFLELIHAFKNFPARLSIYALPIGAWTSAVPLGNQATNRPGRAQELRAVSRIQFATPYDTSDVDREPFGGVIYAKRLDGVHGHNRWPDPPNTVTRLLRIESKAGGRKMTMR